MSPHTLILTGHELDGCLDFFESGVEWSLSHNSPLRVVVAWGNNLVVDEHWVTLEVDGMTCAGLSNSIGEFRLTVRGTETLVFEFLALPRTVLSCATFCSQMIDVQTMTVDTLHPKLDAVPVCTCDSQSFFWYGCKCAYSKRQIK